MIKLATRDCPTQCCMARCVLWAARPPLGLRPISVNKFWRPSKGQASAVQLSEGQSESVTKPRPLARQSMPHHCGLPACSRPHRPVNIEGVLSSGIGCKGAAQVCRKNAGERLSPWCHARCGKGVRAACSTEELPSPTLDRNAKERDSVMLVGTQRRLR